jgi:uncharacterized protein
MFCNDKIDKVGLPTLTDIMDELAKPGRDPRALLTRNDFSAKPTFDPSVKEFEDIKVGMYLPGKVTNATAFGVFVNIGIKDNGLIHVSKLPRQRANQTPVDILTPDQRIMVTVVSIDHRRKRIALSMLPSDIPSHSSSSSSVEAAANPVIIQA